MEMSGGVSVMSCDLLSVSLKGAGVMIKQATAYVRRIVFYSYSFKFMRRRSATVNK